MGNHPIRNLFFFLSLSNGITGIDGRGKYICFYVYYFFFFCFVCRSLYVEISFLPFFHDTRRPLSFVRFLYGGRKRKDGKVLVLLPAEAFFLKPETHLSVVVFQKGTEGMRKQLRQMWTLGTRPSARPVVLTVIFFLLSRGGNFYIDWEETTWNIFPFQHSGRNVSNTLYIYIYILRKDIWSWKFHRLFNWTIVWQLYRRWKLKLFIYKRACKKHYHLPSVGTRVGSQLYQVTSRDWHFIPYKGRV